MAFFLTVHARYHDVQWGLFDGNKRIISTADESKKISKHFIETLDRMLKKSNLSLSDLSFIAVHQGPAPFTTLRVCLSTVNGIGFASGLPLIGVNGLEALLDEHTIPGDQNITIALLNAFSHDVYYALYDPKSSLRSLGYAQGEKFLTLLKEQYQGPLTFLGNGCTLYEKSIVSLFGTQAQVKAIDMVSLEQIAQNAYAKWKKNDTQNEIMPIYLKEYSIPLHPQTI
jgi:tRNA threonylcarbamoyl adenosine modification protein YeaZ